MNNFSDAHWSNLIYLLLLLSMLLTGLFARRDISFMKIIKYLAIWSGIGLAIILLYSYRFEFNDFKARILGEINPRAAKINEYGEIVINISQDGHFYLNTKANGQAISFMVDTGASDIVIGLKDAKRLGIDIKKLQFNKRYQTANGQVLGASAILNKLEFADLVFYDVKISINNSEMGTALMGMGFLNGFRKYEFSRDKLTLSIDKNY